MPRKQEEQNEIGELGWGQIIKALVGCGTMAGAWKVCGTRVVCIEKATTASW